MTIQMSTTLRNGRLDQITSIVGTSALIEIFTGSQPENCAAADTGTKLATLTGNATALAAAAASGVLTFNAITQDSSADATGTAAHYRLKTSGGTCHMQGSVTVTGGGGDMTFTSVSFVTGEPISMTSWTITEPGA